MSNDRRAFSMEFEREAIDLVRRIGKSANQVAKELGVNQTTLIRSAQVRWQCVHLSAQRRHHAGCVFSRHLHQHREV